MRSQGFLAIRRVAAAVPVLAFLGCASPLDSPVRPNLAGGAGSQTAAGTETGPGAILAHAGFYPLEIGNRWLYRREFVQRIVLDEGATYAYDPEYSWVERELVCREPRGGASYLVERVTRHTIAGSATEWWRYRQDLLGLYELDLAGTEPPLCGAAAPAGIAGAPWLREPPSTAAAPAGSAANQAAFRSAAVRLRERVAKFHAALDGGRPPMLAEPLPGTPGLGELLRLRYPLRAKARWTIRNDDGVRLTAEVERLETLDLPPGRLSGYRIRLRFEPFGPADVVHVWYGRAGFLQLRGHYEMEARDFQGNPIGRLIADEVETLEELHLAPTTPFGLPDAGPGK